ncbi:hypothetical protein BJ912DRAFT_99342 [Pholiota molesta]|nr:hypothetical protein BJ912DRAFT_99342 [Pholiota molesta]
MHLCLLVPPTLTCCAHIKLPRLPRLSSRQHRWAPPASSHCAATSIRRRQGKNSRSIRRRARRRAWRWDGALSSSLLRVLPSFSAPARTRRAARHVTPSRRQPPLCPASAASATHVIHCPPHRVCPLHSPQGQCPRRAHFNSHRPHQLPLPMSTPSVDVDLRARPDLPRCNDSPRPFRPPRRPTTRHRTHFDSPRTCAITTSSGTTPTSANGSVERRYGRNRWPLPRRFGATLPVLLECRRLVADSDARPTIVPSL